MAKEATPQPETPAKEVYTFRVKGTNRTYDVDRPHLDAMRSRADMEYIGTIPLPKEKK